MRELSLFSGAGGGILGSKLLGWKTLGYVEFNDYCQRVIRQRIKDGIFDNAPIFGDVRTFVSEGYARKYRGMVDVVTGGFPCQPFSVAGKRKASDDSRDMWPATLDVIKAVKPPVVYLENVPGLLSATVDDSAGRLVHYFGAILRDLSESGYDVKWCVLGADDVGAPHHRKRLWILGVYANPKCDGSSAATVKGIDHGNARTGAKGAECAKQSKGMDKPKTLANSKQKRLQGRKHERRGISERERIGDQGGNVNATYADSGRQSGSWWAFDPSDSAAQREGQEYRTEHDRRWSTESVLGRVANGVVDRSHRLKAIGNGQVPITMAAAYEILSAEFAK